MTVADFHEIVWDYYSHHRRSMPWRDEPTLYHVIVSELMLQQTQVARVLPKYRDFLQAFPSFQTLAAAPLADVLRAWQGLGYNRRAKYLHESARRIVTNGVPRTMDELVQLPGIGINTAGAIMNYVYDEPTPFVETNIRTVYFVHFFSDQSAVSDREVLRRVAATMPNFQRTEIISAREWFWALMDYGSHLKSIGKGHLGRSKHYVRQTPFRGSVREVRGQIMAALSRSAMDEVSLKAATQDDERFLPALQGLRRDGLVAMTGSQYHLTK